MRLRYIRQGHAYRGRVAFEPGEEKDIEEPEATRLLDTFPEWFERAGKGEAYPGSASVAAEGERSDKALAEPPLSKPVRPRVKGHGPPR